MRRTLTLFVLTALAVFSATAQVNTINTVAGGGAQPGAATAAYLPQPVSTVRDSANNTYISVPTLNTVYLVNAAGTLSAYAGNGINGFSGDGGPAAQAQLSFPQGLAIDSSNNLFIADSNNNRIRRVDAASHVITTVAGSEDPFFGAYAGDGGLATSARLNVPTDVAVDSTGDLFIADNGNGVVRKVAATTQIITTYAGSNPPGDVSPGCNSGSASNALFGSVFGVAVDKSGNVFASDAKLDIVCKIDASQNVSLYAGTLNNPGTPGAANGDGGPAIAAQLNRPLGLATDSAGNLYIADAGNPKIRRVDTSASNIITSVAGIGTICTTAAEPGCGDGGPATSAAFDSPNGVFVDAGNNILVADTGNMRVRVVSAANSTVTNFAGSGSGGDGGAATSSVLGLVQTLVTDANENVFGLESAGVRIREIDVAGNINTVAGTGFGGATMNCAAPCNGDGGTPTAAQFVDPQAIATDSQGNFFIVDATAGVVRVINNGPMPLAVAGMTVQPGTIATIAGNGTLCKPGTSTYPTCGDGGPATSAGFDTAVGIAVDASENIFISDQALNTVRLVDSTGTITTFVGTPGQACTTYRSSGCGQSDNAPTSALLNGPIGLVVSPQMSSNGSPTGQTDLFIADSGDNVIPVVSYPTGTPLSALINMFAFNGIATFGDGILSATQASMFDPLYLAVDNLENLYIGGGLDNVVLRVDRFSNTIETIAGDVNNLNGGFSGDGGPSTQAMIENAGMAVFTTPVGTHDLFIADSGSNRIRKVNLAPISTYIPISGSTLTFPVTLDGQRNTLPLEITNSGLDDLVITNVTLSDTTDFSLTAPSCFGANPPIVVPPEGQVGVCIAEVSFNPGPNANGVINATLTFTTNDPANPNLSYTLSGTATNSTNTLSISLTPPAGSLQPGGTVDSSDFSISCSSDNSGPCSAAFPSGSTVVLSAIPDTNFAFSTWGGACAAFGSSPVCQVTMNGNQSASATFAASTPTTPPPTTINIVGLGAGSGTITDGATLNCTVTNGVTSGTCTANYTTGGSNVTLSATPGSGASFVGWLGNLCFPYNQSTCTIFPSGGTLAVAPVFTVSPPLGFTKGQVFLSTEFGMVFVLDPATGNVVQVLSSGATGGAGEGLTFDEGGSLYLANPSANQVEQFAINGTGPALFGTGSFRPWSPVIDPSGNLLVGQLATECDCVSLPPAVLEFPPGSSSLTTASATFFPGFETFSPPANWIELLDSGDTIAYTNGGQTVQVYDLGEQTQHADMITGLNGAFALRELPDDTLLVADSTRIVKIDQSGNILQTYTPGEAIVQNLNLDPDGLSFWTNDEVTGTLYRINIQTGAVMNGSGYATGLGFGSGTGLITQGIGGIAVSGQSLSGGADLAVTISAPSVVPANTNITYSLTVSNNGPLNATGVTLITTIPNALPVGLSPANCSSVSNGSSTTITCPIGNLAANAPPVAATFTMSPLSPGTITATATVSGGQSDPNLANNTASVTTSTGPVCTLNVVPNSGMALLKVTATASCSDAAATITSTTLTFGDGSGAVNGTTAQHTYVGAGAFTVTVTAIDSLGLNATATQVVNVSANLPPACTLTVAPAAGKAPLPITATGNCTDPDGDTLVTTLNFGDGTTQSATGGTHTYSTPGTYMVTLTATDPANNSVTTSQTVTVTNGSFAPGVFVGFSGGTIKQFASNGTVIKTFSTGVSGTVADLNFDKAGNLYTVNFTAGGITEVNVTTGAVIGPFGSGYNCQPESMVFDGAGNVYVGQQGCSLALLKFDPTGKLLATYNVATEEQGSDDLALSADNCTMLYTSEGQSILRYDVCHNQQLAPFATGLNKALNLKILSDGGVLVADLADIVRFNAAGTRTTTYTVPGAQCLYGVALDQDGKTFWTDDFCSSTIFHIDLTSGSVLSQFGTVTGPDTVFGLAIAGSGLNVAGLGNAGTVTTSPQSATLTAGQSATFTVSLTPNAAAAGLTLTLSCAGLPPGLSCSFNPPTLTLGAAGTTSTAQMTISRTNTAALMHPASPWALATWLAVIPAMVLAGLRSPRRRRGTLLWLGLIVVGTGLWASCGGGGTSMNQSTGQQTTPAGTFTVIVVGSANGMQASTTVNITAN